LERNEGSALTLVADGAVLGFVILHGDFEHIIAAYADAVNFGCFVARLALVRGARMLSCVRLAHEGILTRYAGSARWCDISYSISQSANLALIGVCAGMRQTGLLQFYASGVATGSTAQPTMEKNSRSKWIVAALAVTLIVIVLVVLAGRGQAPAVSIAQVSREDLTASITSNGKVEPISRITARAQFPTFVDKVMVSEGQSVHRGQLILSLNAADIGSQLAQARQDLLSAQTTLRNARAGGPPNEVAQLGGDLEKAKAQVANLERTQASLTDLVAKQAATQDELNQNQALLAEARANLQALEQKTAALKRQTGVDAEAADLRVKQAQGQVQSLEEKLHSATVTAEVDGTLYSLPVHAGDYVKVGDILAEMADLRQVRVRAFVDEPDLGSLEPNEDVKVNWDAMPNRTWTGKVEQVPKQVVARGTRSVGEVLCSVQNDKVELLPNVNVEVHILVRQRPGVLVVPRRAVSYENGQHYVFVFDGEKVHRRQFEVGIASDKSYEVVSGLALGDKIALPGDVDLKDGMEVRVTEAK
jgi:HlyD family secretion protein